MMGRRWPATWVLLMLVLGRCGFAGAEGAGKALHPKAKTVLAELKACEFKIIYETYRTNNWELVIMNADGSNPVNLTRTPDVDEMYPHASPDGTKVVFVAEKGKGRQRTRDVYLMNIDGTGRVKVARSGRQPFWSPNGKRIGYSRGAHVSYREGGGANKELYFYNIETRKNVRHPKKDISGLLSPCWSSDSRWIIASAMGGMGFGHSIVAIDVNGTKVVELARSHSEAKNVYQCRPDVSPDGKHVAWGKEDVDNHFGFGRKTMWVEVGDIDQNSPTPKITDRRYVVTVKHPLETYHADWSPDSKYIAYSQGRRGGRMARARYVVGVRAEGWDIWVVKPSEPGVAVQLTHDGLSNKEPDWVFVGRRKGVHKR